MVVPSALISRMMAKNLLDEHGCQAQRRLVQQQQSRPGHERPPDGQHLLLAAGQGAAALCRSLPEPGEQRVHVLRVVGHFASRAGVAPHLEVLGDGQP